jgi:hypothetical protein
MVGFADSRRPKMLITEEVFQGISQVWDPKTCPPLEPAAFTHFLYQVCQNYRAQSAAGYPPFRDGGTMSLDIKHLALQPESRFWHLNCNSNVRRRNVLGA